MSEYAGLANTKGFQYLLNAASWDTDGVRD